MVSLLSICFGCFRTIDNGLRLNTKLVKVCTTLKHTDKSCLSVHKQQTRRGDFWCVCCERVGFIVATAVRLYELLRRCVSTSDTPPFTGTLTKSERKFTNT